MANILHGLPPRDADINLTLIMTFMYDIEMYQWHAYTVQLRIVYALKLISCDTDKLKLIGESFINHPSHLATACSYLATLHALLYFIHMAPSEANHYCWLFTNRHQRTKPSLHVYSHVYIVKQPFTPMFHIRKYTVGPYTPGNTLISTVLVNQITTSWIEAYLASQASHLYDYFTPCQYTQTCHCTNRGLCQRQMVIG